MYSTKRELNYKIEKLESRIRHLEYKVYDLENKIPSY